MMLEACGSKKIYFGGMGRVLGCATLVATLGIFAHGAAAQQAPAKSPAAPAKKSAARAAAGPQTGQQTFASCEDASKGLVAALQSDDPQELLKVLGPSAKDIVSSGDETADKEERTQMVQKYQQMHRLVMEPDGTTTLYIGAENWPTPIPLMHQGNKWYFDSAAGKQEILYRRVGRNELAVIQVCSELVDAEKEYYGQPHDGQSANRYAEKFFSDSGKHNGLFWNANSGEPESPIGPLVAAAAAEGYTPGAGTEPQPFDGYYFRMLKSAAVARTQAVSQSSAESNPAASGFAFVAYPAKYRSSGVMTFLVDQNGIVYEKDLGPRTDEIAKAMTRYRRDATWRKAD
jgi:hypothetical protein